MYSCAIPISDGQSEARPEVNHVADAGPHTPPLHVCVEGHAWPQVPQSLSRTAVCAQLPGVHSVQPLTHSQLPDVQAKCPVVLQTLPHPPQCASLVVVSTHAPLQHIDEVPHDVPSQSESAQSIAPSQSSSAPSVQAVSAAGHASVPASTSS